MAKLIVPTEAICLIQHAKKKKKKYHLLKQNGMYSGKMTVCGYCICYDKTPEEIHQTHKNVSELKKEEFCEKCLGAIKAED